MLPSTRARPDVPLETLLNHVILARSALADGRHTNLGQAGMDHARAEMLTSLEAYVSALNTLHLPVPYTLRDELRTQRAAYRCGSGNVVRAQPTRSSTNTSP